jgi:asparagine synthase (glutamine-hydrolysing)
VLERIVNHDKCGKVIVENLREIPRFDTHGGFYDAGGRVASRPNDLATAASRPDESALFSVLQFGAIVPPLSPWEGVRRFLPGHRYQGTEDLGPAPFPPSRRLEIPDHEAQADALEALLDQSLTEWIGDGGDPVLLFSGGVDSGLIASRLVALGRRDSLLLNYSFGEEDPESILAEAMAARLGLRFERVVVPGRRLCDSLIDPGRVYPQPFADSSTVPTSELAQATVRRLAGERRLILDGTGADGAFGMARRIVSWGHVYSIPAFARRAVSSLYGAAHLWTNLSRVEFVCRVFRHSVQMPMLPAVLCQNPLAGFLYRDAGADRVHRLLEDWIGGWGGDSPLQRIVTADLALTCANRFAQKGQPILEAAGHTVRYPFLRDDMVAAALSILPEGRMREPKAILKHSLARRVPRDMVYRPKSGFADPRRRVLYEPVFLEYLRAAGDSGGPIAPLLEKRVLLEACDLLSRGRMLPAYTRNALWAIVFLDRWYRTAR